MILFQETGDAVSFSPENFTRNPPWQEKLLGLYLLAILIVLLVRIIQLTQCLRTLRKLDSAGGDAWEKTWALGNLGARALMRFAVLTFFISCLEISLTFTNDLWRVGTQKVAHSWWLLIDFARDLGAFNVGMLVCGLLYSFGFFFESRLERRKLAMSPAAAPCPTD